MSEEILEFDEDCVTTNRRADPEKLVKAATRGWKTLSTGFDDLTDQHSPLLNTNKRKQSSDRKESKRRLLLSDACISKTLNFSPNVTIAAQPMTQKENLSLTRSVHLDINLSDSQKMVKKREAKCKNIKKWAFSDLSNNCDTKTNRQIESDLFPKRNNDPVIIEDVQSSDSPPAIMDYISDVSSNQSSQQSQENLPMLFTSLQAGCSKKSPLLSSSKSSIKGRDWLGTLRGSDCTGPMAETQYSSGKSHHSRNFLLDGLAQQSSKLENKLKTSRVLWNHQKPEKSKKYVHKCLKVFLKTCNSIDGFLLAKCQILETPSSSAPFLNSSDSSITLSSQDSAKGPNYTVIEEEKPNFSDKSKGYCNVVMKVNQQAKLPSVGSVVQLFPPWQSLQIPTDPYPTILSCYFIEVFKYEIHQNPNSIVKEIVLPKYSKKDLLESAKRTALLSRLPYEGLHINSRPPYVVTVLGTITDVDREGSLTWLRCVSCSQTELYQDTKDRVFCPRCNKVTKTVLIMKVKVFVKMPQLPNASILVELTSLTAKRILNFSDAEIQPQCDVSNVLNKEVGPIQCRILSRKELGNDKVFFRLKEMNN